MAQSLNWVMHGMVAPERERSAAHWLSSGEGTSRPFNFTLSNSTPRICRKVKPFLASILRFSSLMLMSGLSGRPTSTPAVLQSASVQVSDRDVAEDRRSFFARNGCAEFDGQPGVAQRVQVEGDGGTDVVGFDTVADNIFHDAAGSMWDLKRITSSQPPSALQWSTWMLRMPPEVSLPMT